MKTFAALRSQYSVLSTQYSELPKGNPATSFARSETRYVTAKGGHA